MTTNLQFDLERFWTLEEVNISKTSWSNEDLYCEEHFKKHIKRNSEGRYIVALPFKQSAKNLGESRQIALKRLMFLEKRFKKNIDLKNKYTDVINNYLELNHMSPIQTTDASGFYLPHHAVIKESSNTTKLRVVFDASMKSTNGNSLNDNLLVGPTIQDDLFSQLLQFRTYKYVIIGDIEKMYRQFLIREEDRIYQKILWFDNGEIREYALNTVTFGVNPAPFLAIRCLHQLAEDEGNKFPLASRVLKKNMYVDNMLTGANCKDEAREICHQMINILQTAGLKMYQWASNDNEILNGIAK